MAFILREDFGEAIRENILDQVTQFDDTKLEKASNSAEGYMRGFLNARYDVDAVFNATGNNRNPVIMMFMMDIAVFNLHKLINPRKLPQFRVDNFERAVQWLKDVQKQNINPDLPLPATEGEKQYITFFGNEKLDNDM